MPIEILESHDLSAEMGSISSLDIDIDINANKRQHIFKRLKEEFGEDNFLSVCTFGTNATKSAIKTACKGLGISDDIANHLSSLVPFERGSLWTIEECLYGNEEKEREPITQFINIVDQHEGLRETVLKIQGLVNQRGTHAGGVIVLNNHYVEQNALMKSADGTYTTQFNLDDTQALGAIKMDLLSLDAMTKIQEAMNYLLKDKAIPKERTLRETFYKDFHPDVIDTTSKELFELASTGTVQDLFQFSTAVGYGAVTSTKPSNLIEMMAINSVMRLMNRLGETPLATFAKFKEDIGLWYKEMESYGLTDEEVAIMEEHLLKLVGIADTQESVMLIAMDERVAKFSMEEATFLRKTIAGSSKEKIEKLKNTFYTNGERQGTRKEFLDYIWEVQIGAQLG